MSLNYSKNLFEGWEVAIAKKYVRQFRSTCQCLERDFEDDLVDECLKHWFFVRKNVKPDAEQKRRAYMASVIRNNLSKIVEYRLSKKHSGFFQATSLSKYLEDNPESSFLAHPTQENPVDQIQHSELKLKLDQVFQKLNPQQQKVYLAIQEGGLTIKEVSIRLSLHRSTVYDEINRIKEIFENEGLRKYL